MHTDFGLWLNDKVLHYLPHPQKQNGKDINCRCPICGDSKKSKSKMRGHYYLDTGTYYCFNCDFYASGMKLLEILSGDDYSTLKQEYVKLKYSTSQDFKVPEHKTLNQNIFNFQNIKSVIKRDWKNPLTDEAKLYLDQRKIFESPFAKDLKLYSIKTDNDRDYILIPWTINGIDAYFQINDFKKYGDNKYIFPKHMDKLIFGLDNIDLNFKYIICFEGVYDSIFVKNGVAIGGKKLTALQQNILEQRYPKHQIVLAFDNDISGKKAMMSSINNHDNFKYFDWNLQLKSKAKDINDYIIETNNVNAFADKQFLE